MNKLTRYEQIAFWSIIVLAAWMLIAPWIGWWAP